METVSSDYTRADRLTSWKARWGINRMAYRVRPGLYALGTPGAEAPVFATANYKLSFDALRTNLKGVNAWLLVLDTRGINVWCAAGKGTFGTFELARIIAETGLEKVVKHRTVILPQLGAPGVGAHRVKAATGFTVAYGPVRAEDLPEYLRLGRATPEMRKINFNFTDRMVLAPVQLVHFGRYLVPAAALLYLLGYRADAAYTVGALLAGGALVPALLPWLPGRSFAVKSAAAGLLVTALIALAHDQTPAQFAARALIYSAAASFVGLDFTGASTYTSLSGVKKEMRLAMPAHALAAAAGLAILAAGRFL
ncbi:MAG: acetyl-CoA synthase subunit gamma [Elusimicrobia bacterium HGW-Elusimicrobia-3]|nr:MAG: acetyl-CoA synthase subunit gamma [Elusimicrobia bacterium HGW-Elusimicrobia-3]